MTAPTLDAKARNEAARELAATDPQAVADAAMRSATLPETLGLGEGVETRDGTTYVKIRTDLDEAEAEHTAIVGDVAGNLWLRSQLSGRPGLTGFDSRANAEAICDGLARIPIGDKLAALTVVVETMPVDVEPERRSTAILPESLRAARIAAFAAGMDPLLPLTLTGGEIGEVGTAPVQRPLFEFEAPATNLVPVLPLRFYRDAGGLDRTRGRGAPLAKRIWWAAIAECADRVPGAGRFDPTANHAAPPERVAVSRSTLAHKAARCPAPWIVGGGRDSRRLGAARVAHRRRGCPAERNYEAR